MSLTSSSQVVDLSRSLVIAVVLLSTTPVVHVLVSVSPLPSPPVVFTSVLVVTTLSLVAPTAYPFLVPTVSVIAVSVTGLTNLPVV